MLVSVELVKALGLPPLKMVSAGELPSKPLVWNGQKAA